MERKLEDGGLAVPNIEKYYYAAMLTACLNYWHFSAGNINVQLEQGRCKLALVDWLVLDRGTAIGLEGANGTAIKLGKIWRKHQRYLAPLQSPLMTYANYPGMKRLRQVGYRMFNMAGCGDQ